MTDRQRKFFYFPAWSKACRANDWHMAGGRFAGQRAARHGAPEVDAIYQSVWAAAETLALAEHAAVKPDHLRHACHVIAAGRDKSANDLTNAEVDRVVAIFKLLTEPDDIDAVMAIQHPENDERRRLIFNLKKSAPEALLLAVARNLKTWEGEWEAPFWEDLPLAGIKTLSQVVRAKKSNWAAA